MKPNRNILSLTLTFILLMGSTAASAGYAKRPRIQTFIKHMVSEHDFPRRRLEALMANARHQQQIIDAMNHPAEARPWYAYRPIFMQRERIRQGAAFMRAHRRSLVKAYARYGVPAKIITAILGVETRYGRQMGKLRVLDALTTLAFDYPPRQKFFTRELEQFLVLARQQRINPESVKGSYAGAMGQAQFIASSYRRYAVDFNGNGKTDLWHESADAIGSIANYLHEHGWQPRQPIAARANVAARVTSKTLGALHPNKLEANHTVSALAGKGIRPEYPLPRDMPVGLLRLQGRSEAQFWLGGENFYVITAYNHSALYAMAVYQLGEAISEAGAASHNPPADGTTLSGQK